jgi:cytochrome oxidase Cu insertion factor (SCO1/SenC/PrrC family)
MTGPPVTEFELTERSGKPFRSADMHGQVWAVTYFFTTCPGNCIRLNQNIKFMHNLPELKNVTWVSITCDPVTDTLEALREYADRWEADPERWLFCRGDLEYIKQIGLGMHLPIYRQAHKDYAVVFDKSGKLRGMFDATRKSESQRLRTLLLECLAEEHPATATDAESDSST